MSELSILDCVHSTTYFEQGMTIGLALFSLLSDQPSPALLLSLQPPIYPAPKVSWCSCSQENLLSGFSSLSPSSRLPISRHLYSRDPGHSQLLVCTESNATMQATLPRQQNSLQLQTELQFTTDLPFSSQ